MDSMNRAHTPMVRYDNDLTKSPMQVRKDVNSLTNGQTSKSPYEVGSLNLLNDRITSLEQKLGSYDKEFDKFEKLYRGTDPKYYTADHVTIDNSKKKDYPLVKEFKSTYKKQIANLDKMPLKFEAVETPSPGTEKASRKLQLDFRIEDDDLSAEDKNLARQMEGKPKFVEMYSFPGFDDLSRLEKLPYGVSLNKIIDAVINSQPGMPNKKPRYAAWMRNMMIKEQCRSIILDLFWWFLLDIFKDLPKGMLEKLQLRLSDNYRFFLENVVPFDRYRDPFFNSFAVMLAQAVYASFCHVFPDSFAKYNETFKERILEICGEWFQGIKIASGSWIRWNFVNLEPPGLRLRMEAAEAAAKEDTKRKKGLFNMDWLKNLGPTPTGPVVGFADEQEQNEEEVKPTVKVRSAKKEKPPLEYKQTGIFEYENHLFDVAGHSPLISSSCLRKGIDLNNVGTHVLVKHRYLRPKNFEEGESNYVREMFRRKREESHYQIRKINGVMRNCHINEELRNKKVREHEKAMEEFMADKERVKRMADVLTLQSVSNET